MAIHTPSSASPPGKCKAVITWSAESMPATKRYRSTVQMLMAIKRDAGICALRNTASCHGLQLSTSIVFVANPRPVLTYDPELAMSLFDPLCDFFQRRASVRLDALATGLQLVTLRSEALRDNFVFPGLDFDAAIEQDGEQVGTIEYGVSPLNDRLYISDLKIRPAHQGKGLGLASLWCLSRQYGLPLASMHEVGWSTGFWAKAEWRLASAGVHLQRDIRTGDQPAIKASWAHLVPEPEHERKIRELMASPEWPAIKASMEAEYGPCQEN